MKLKCTIHWRRVHAIEGQLFHRDGEKCDALHAKIGDKMFARDAAQFHQVGPYFCSNPECPEFKACGGECTRKIDSLLGINLKALIDGLDDMVEAFKNKKVGTAMQGVTPKYVIVDEIQELIIP